MSTALAVGSLAPAPAVPVDVTTVAEPDPIFAAIEWHRKCEADYHANADVEDRLRRRGLLRGCERTPERLATVKESLEARLALSKTVPTTLSGLCAYLEYAANYNDRCGILLFEPKETDNFVAAIAEAARNIAGRAS
jgi:hypothetical protein